MKITLTDKLPDISRRDARQTAHQWIGLLSTNTRTPSFKKDSNEVHPDYAVSFHESQGEILQTQDFFDHFHWDGITND